MIRKSFFVFLSFGMLLVSCGRNPLSVNVSGVKTDITFINLDEVLAHADSSELLRMHHRMQDSLKDIYEYTLGYCLQIQRPTDSTFYKTMRVFREDQYVSRLEKRIAEHFTDLSPIEAKITDGFRHLKYHFPKGSQPNHVLFINSLFAANASANDTDLAIGLERYLGPETDVIKELPAQTFFEWIKEGMQRKYLERDALCAWIMTNYVAEEDGFLAEAIIRWGKILYLTEACFPDEKEAIIIRYSEEDLKWAYDNEYAYWDYLVKQQLLFKNNERDKMNMLGDAPFTVGLPEKGPDRLGQFLGWQIVRQYMEDNDITLKELLATPYDKILKNYEAE